MAKMKKTTLAAFVLAAAGFATTSVSAFPITPFPRSLPNQAGVNYEFLWGAWDYITTPAYYTMQEKDALSFFLTPNPGNGTLQGNLGGKTSVGIPLYWAIGLKTRDATTKTTEFTPATGTGTTKTDGKSDLAVQIGSEFGGFGVGVFTHMINKTQKCEGATTTAACTGTGTAGSSYEDPSDSSTEAGVNLGQNFENGTVWGAGLSYKMNGGKVSTKTTTTETAGDQTSTGTLGTGVVTPDESNTIKVSTFGWVPMGTEGDLLGWLVTVDNTSGTTDYSTTTSGTATKYGSAELADMNASVGVFYTLALPLGKDAVFYVNPELGIGYGSKTETTADATATNKFEKKTNKMELGFNLPIMFGVNITETLMMNVGWYPAFQLMSSTTVEDTATAGGTSTTSKTTTAGEMLALDTDLFGYGMGLTWNANQNLAVHINATANRGPNVTNIAGGTSNGNLNAAEIAVGVDYFFSGSSAARVEDAATTVEDTADSFETE